MPWRPLNDVLIVDPDPIVKYDGSIVLCEKNSEEKISPYGTIVSWGDKCKYKYKVGQRIMMHTVNSIEYRKPQYLECEGKKYRIINESDLHAVLE